jgi:hypothetical protein
MQSGFAALFITPNPKKNGDGDQLVDDKPFIDERKPSSMTVAKGNFNNGEHTLIPVTAKMIHSAVWECKRLGLKDGRLLHMVKFVGAVSVRNFNVNTKYVQIDVEDGTRLVQVILWKKERECTAQRRLIHECNSNRYNRVIGEVEDYYGVHEIIAFDDIFIDSPIFNRNIVNGVSNMTWWKYSKPQLIPTKVILRKNM